MIVTSNHSDDPDPNSRTLSGAESAPASTPRLREMCEVIEYTGADYRTMGRNPTDRELDEAWKRAKGREPQDLGGNPDPAES